MWADAETPPMRLPSTTSPEGVLEYLLAFIIVAGLVFLVLFWAGVWTG
jgi:hypothetical protein